MRIVNIDYRRVAFFCGWCEHLISRLLFLDLLFNLYYFGFFGYSYRLLVISVFLWLWYWVSHKLEKRFYKKSGYVRGTKF